MDLYDLLKATVDQEASDLHITVGIAPTIRVHGLMRPMLQYPHLTMHDTEKICLSILTPQQRAHFEQHKELDLSIGVKGLCRFRVNIFVQKEAVAAVFRTIPSHVKPLNTLGLPPMMGELARRHSGLFLVTGPTGSGKSTTLASVVDQINRERACHIVTLEDPIEYLHTHKRALINQREIGVDTANFHNALRAVLRQDPDVVLVGEMRDLETIEAALRISETGHLCLATLHTQSAMQSITRIIDMFPVHQRQQVRMQLSFSLQGVLSQRLIPKADGKGRVLAAELLVLNQAIRHQIRDDKLHQIQGQIQMGQGKSGMVTMNQSLIHLYRTRQIQLEDARANSNDLEEFTNMLVHNTTTSGSSSSRHSHR
jgi:twitching motility protein PilT